MGIEEAILHEMKTKGIDEGKKIGREQGIELGKEQKERIFVTRGRQKGLSPEEIADLGDIPLEKVETIIQELIQILETEEEE